MSRLSSATPKAATTSGHSYYQQYSASNFSHQMTPLAQRGATAATQSRISLKTEKGHAANKMSISGAQYLEESSIKGGGGQSWKLMPPTTTPPKKEQIINQTLQKSIEIIKGKQILFSLKCLDRLYWYCNSDPPKNVPDSFFFNIDPVLVYQGYNKDFGPLNLA